MRDREVSFFEGTPVVGFFYTWTSHSATVTNSTAREVCCFNCRTSFEYQVTRTARGGGHSPFHMSQKRAAEDARRRAFINVSLALRDAIEPVYCPSCGVFQPDMVQELRTKLGLSIDPNKYARERLVIPFRIAWQIAIAEDTPEAYRHFTEVWPSATGSVYAAKERIKFLTRLPLVAFTYKLAPLFATTVWVLILLIFLYFIFMTVRER